MSGTNWINDVKVGDYVRYLGGDWENKDLIVGRLYKTVLSDETEIAIEINRDDMWGIGDFFENTHCFELVGDTETGDTGDEGIVDMLASLAAEFSKLKRRVDGLEANMTARTEFERFAATAEDARMVAGKAREDVLALAYDLDEMRRRLNSEEGERLIEEFREFIESRRN